LTDQDLPIVKLIEKISRKKIKDTFVEDLLKEAHLI